MSSKEPSTTTERPNGLDDEKLAMGRDQQSYRVASNTTTHGNLTQDVLGTETRDPALAAKMHLLNEVRA